MEIELIGVGFAIIGGALVYNLRIIYDLKSKVDFIYRNMKIIIEWKKNNGGNKC